jgi:hypothetical protein
VVSDRETGNYSRCVIYDQSTASERSFFELRLLLLLLPFVRLC